MVAQIYTAHDSGGPLTTDLQRCGDPIPISSVVHFYVHSIGHHAETVHIGMVANISAKSMDGGN